MLPDYYTKTLGVPYYVPFDDSHFPKPPVVWASWDNYYAELTEQDMIRNTDWLADHLKAYGVEYVRLDDSYDRGRNGEHYWIDQWNHQTFPHGLKWIADAGVLHLPWRQRH
jgi:alpha-galactosidase